MKAVFKELSIFADLRARYLNDEQFRQFQNSLMRNPKRGAVIKGTGGLRKIRLVDPRRGKGTRSGIRVIYYYEESASVFWLFIIYDKDEMDDLTKDEKKELKKLLEEALAHG